MEVTAAVVCINSDGDSPSNAGHTPLKVVCAALG